MLFPNNCDFKNQVQTYNTYKDQCHMPGQVSSWSEKMIQMKTQPSE